MPRPTHNKERLANEFFFIILFCFNFCSYLQKRIDVFVELLSKGDITKVNVDTTNTEALIRLLDTAVIKLEGGSDDDLKVLDEKPIVINTIQPKIAEEKPKPVVVDEKLKNEENADNVSEKKEETTPMEVTEESTKGKKRRRTHSDSSSSSDSSSDSETTDNEKSKDDKPEENGNGTEKNDDDEDENNKEEGEEDKDDQSQNQTEEKDDDMEKSSDENKEQPESEKEQEKFEDDKVDEVVDLDKEDDDDVKSKKKLEELHKTSSIFLRNLAPTITKAEVEAVNLLKII